MRKEVVQLAGGVARRRDAIRAGDDYGVHDLPDWRTLDWPAHLCRTELLGAEVNYVDVGDPGDRRPLVFVHGLGGQWQNWLENVPRLSQARRVVALDLPGFGMSPMPPETITIDYYGRIVAELCRRLDLAPAVLVGNSMGGYVAAETAIVAPEAVERLVLVSSAGISQRYVARAPALRAARLLSFATTHGAAARARRDAARPALRHWILSMVVRHPTRIDADTAYEALMKGSGKPGFYDALITCLDYDFVDRLPEIACPTLVVWGRNDMVIPARDADRFVELIGGSQKLILEDTGHVPMLERPVTFNDELQAFVDYDVAPGELEQDRAAASTRDQVA